MRRFSFSLSGRCGKDAFDQLASSTYFAVPPAAIEIDYEEVVVTPTWSSELARSKSAGRAWWHDRPRQLAIRPKNGPLVIGTVNVERFTLHFGVGLIEPLPFEVCAFGAVFFDEWIAADYERWAFSVGHIDHGWACAFRGVGHDRLVSRRWLDFGPWLTLRRPGDLTFIQFHDLAITDPAEAYAQAKIGHERMGLSYTGGYLLPSDEMLDSVSGLYLPEHRRLEIVVAPDVTVAQYEMLCACAVRYHYRQDVAAAQSWHPGKSTIGPVDAIAYVFMDEEQARAHLHELWLRELECWVVDDRGKRRLDADYHPQPVPPAWVERLGA